MFGIVPPLPDGKKCYCPECGLEQSTSSDWQFDVSTNGWAHHHQDGSAHTGIRLTDAEAEEKFPRSRIIQRDGGSCIIFDIDR